MQRWVRRFARLVVAGALLVGPAEAAHASGFTFYGSGDGHGIGMSQWGAYGLAQMGWTHGQILRHFYRHTDVGVADTLPNKIRVGLTSGRTLIPLTAGGGPVRLWLGEPSQGHLIGSIPAGATWRVIAKQAKWAIRRTDGHLVGGRLWGSEKIDLVVTYADTCSRVFIPEADAIWYHGFSYADGTLEMTLS